MNFVRLEAAAMASPERIANARLTVPPKPLARHFFRLT